MGQNDGHRERLRRRFENEGLDHFEPHEVLELLLFFVIPRGNVNHIAHRLIDRFRSLRGVFHATMKDLTEVEGVGPQAAFFLKLIPAVCRRYMISVEQDKFILPIDSSERIREYVAPYFVGRTVETLFLLCINNAGLPISCNYISEGVANASLVDIRRIMETVVNTNAVAVALCHNHPDGLALPSPSDIELTEKIRDFLASVGVTLIDHLVFSGDDCVSLYDSDLYIPHPPAE